MLYPRYTQLSKADRFMKIIGLTGGIAMGKSTAATMLRRMGVPVHDSDAAVHHLYAKGGAAVSHIAKAFPDVVKDGSVDRAALREAVLGKPAALKKLEALIHPLVRQHSQNWLSRHRIRRTRLVVLDIPLLFETGRDREVDEIWVVNCPALVQQQRALARPGMDAEKLAAILDRQVPQSHRLRCADRVFQTGIGKAALLRDLKSALTAV